MTDQQTQYMLTITRFSCGCLYRTTVDRAVFCPAHRSRQPVGFITGVETIRSPVRVDHSLARLAMNPRIPTVPIELRSTDRNSLHQQVRTMDPGGTEWNQTTDETGLCAPCMVDHEDSRETRIAACECGNPDCPYRWCGSLQGLHALWRPHVQGTTEQDTGIPDRDIFSHGPQADLSDRAREALHQERQELQAHADRLLQETLRARRMPPTPAGRPEGPAGTRTRTRIPHPAYLSPWLDPQHRLLADPGVNPRDRQHAASQIQGKLLRLMLIGALPRTSSREPGEGRRIQLALFT